MGLGVSLVHFLANASLKCLLRLGLSLAIQNIKWGWVWHNLTNTGTECGKTFLTIAELSLAITSWSQYFQDLSLYLQSLFKDNSAKNNNVHNNKKYLAIKISCVTHKTKVVFHNIYQYISLSMIMYFWNPFITNLLSDVHKY